MTIEAEKMIVNSFCQRESASLSLKTDANEIVVFLTNKLVTDVIFESCIRTPQSTTAHFTALSEAISRELKILLRLLEISFTLKKNDDTPEVCRKINRLLSAKLIVSERQKRETKKTSNESQDGPISFGAEDFEKELDEALRPICKDKETVSRMYDIFSTMNVSNENAEDNRLLKYASSMRTLYAKMTKEEFHFCLEKNQWVKAVTIIQKMCDAQANPHSGVLPSIERTELQEIFQAIHKKKPQDTNTPKELETLFLHAYNFHYILKNRAICDASNISTAFTSAKTLLPLGTNSDEYIRKSIEAGHYDLSDLRESLKKIDSILKKGNLKGEELKRFRDILGDIILNKKEYIDSLQTKIQDIKKIASQWYDNKTRLEEVQKQLDGVNVYLSEFSLLNTRYKKLSAESQGKIITPADWNNLQIQLLHNQTALKSRLDNIDTILHSPPINEKRVKDLQTRIGQLNTINNSPIPKSVEETKKLKLAPSEVLTQCKETLKSLPDTLENLKKEMSMLSVHEKKLLSERLLGKGVFSRSKIIAPVKEINYLRNVLLSEFIKNHISVTTDHKQKMTKLLLLYRAGGANPEDLASLENLLDEVRQFSPAEKISFFQGQEIQKRFDLLEDELAHYILTPTEERKFQDFQQNSPRYAKTENEALDTLKITVKGYFDFIKSSVHNPKERVEAIDFALKSLRDFSKKPKQRKYKQAIDGIIASINSFKQYVNEVGSSSAPGDEIKSLLESIDFKKDYENHVAKLLSQKLQKKNEGLAILNAMVALYDVKKLDTALEAFDLLKQRGFLKQEDNGTWALEINKVNDVEKNLVRLLRLNSQLPPKQQYQFKDKMGDLKEFLSNYSSINKPVNAQNESINLLDKIASHKKQAERYTFWGWVSAFTGIGLLWAAPLFAKANEHENEKKMTEIKYKDPVKATLVEATPLMQNAPNTKEEPVPLSLKKEKLEFIDNEKRNKNSAPPPFKKKQGQIVRISEVSILTKVRQAATSSVVNKITDEKKEEIQPLPEKQRITVK